MSFFRRVCLLSALLCSNTYVLCQEINHELTDRQIFTSLRLCASSDLTCLEPSSTSTESTSSSVITSSSTRRNAYSTSILKTTSSTRSSSPSISSLLSTASSTISTKPSGIYDPYALTTTFTQPPECTGGFTAIEDWGTEIYDNLIFSSAGYNLTYTSCFPPQFYSSVLAEISNTLTTLPPFKALICPATWENYLVNSTYVICCPKGYVLNAPHYDDPVRPGASAVCSLYLGRYELMDVTTFDLRGREKVVPMTAGLDGDVAWANAFEGFIAAAVSTPTSPSLPGITSSHTAASLTGTTASSPSSPTSPSSTPSAASSSKPKFLSNLYLLCMSMSLGMMISSLF